MKMRVRSRWRPDHPFPFNVQIHRAERCVEFYRKASDPKNGPWTGRRKLPPERCQTQWWADVTWAERGLVGQASMEMQTAGYALMWAASFHTDAGWVGSAGEVARSALMSLGIDPDAGGDGETASHGEVLAMIVREWRQHADRFASNSTPTGRRWRDRWYRRCVHRANKWLRYLGVSRVFGKGVD